MKNYLLFDDPSWDHLLPLTFTRPTCELRVGVMTLRERWELLLGVTMGHITQDYLSELYPSVIGDDNVIINGNVVANSYIAKLISELDPQEALIYQDDLIAARLSEEQFEKLVRSGEIDELKGVDLQDTPVVQIKHPYDLWKLNATAIQEDMTYLPLYDSRALPDHCIHIGSGQLYIHPTAKVYASTFNTSDGPIYIGEGVEVQEGCNIRGPFAVGAHSIVKMQTRINGDVSIGPHCRVAGEISRSVILGYSNKGHDGYLGNSVIGAWCNLGADTNTSNLKNNYNDIKMYNYAARGFESTDSIFGGVIMGDHTKCSINTMINSGSSFGVGCTLFEGGFPPKVLPSFSWGTQPGDVYDFKKFIATAERVMARRNVTLTGDMVRVLHHIHKSRTEASA